MFCPQCGTDVPNSARFCPKCGNTFNAVPQQAFPQAASRMSGISSMSPVSLNGSINIMRLIAVGIAVLAIIFAFLPWLDISMYAHSVSYSVFGFPELSSNLSQSAGVTSAIGSYSSALGSLIPGMDAVTNQANSYTAMIKGASAMLTAIFVFWLISLLATAVGAVLMFVTRKRNPIVFLVGTGLMALVCIVWIAYVAYLGSASPILGQSLGWTAFPVICAIASICALVLTVISNKSAA